MTTMLKKFRAYDHFIKRQQKHKDAFGIHTIRAVSLRRTRRLMQLVHHPLVCGPAKRSGLFGFTISTMLAGTSSACKLVALSPATWSSRSHL